MYIIKTTVRHDSNHITFTKGCIEMGEDFLGRLEIACRNPPTCKIRNKTRGRKTFMLGNILQRHRLTNQHLMGITK